MEKNKLNQKPHEPVLLDEVISYLRVKELAHLKKVKIIDATVGLGGYTQVLVKLGCNVLGIESDRETLKVAENYLKSACPSPDSSGGSYKLVHGNFRKIDEIAQLYNFTNVDAVVFDLGISSFQLASDRGFSFYTPSEVLDMRVDRDSQGVKACDLLNVLSTSQLIRLFGIVMSQNLSRKLAKKIVEKRRYSKFQTVGDLLNVISKVIKKDSKLHPATLPFLALRIAVNSELENLKEALPRAFNILAKEARLAVVSFHSKEDAIVKEYFKQMVLEKRAVLIIKKPILPKRNEIERNPRARSAKLRVIEKI